MAVEFLNKIPLPNQPGNVQNYAVANRSTNDNDQFTTRVDRMLSENDTLFGRFTFANYETFRPFGSTQLNEELVPGFGTNITTRTRNLAINQTHVFSPTLIHEMRFGFLRVNGGQELENTGNNFAQRAGLAGVTGDASKAGYPALNFADAYSSMGDPSNVVSRNNDSIDVFSNLSWIKNSHTVKVGAYFYRLYFNPSESLNARGTFNFTPRFTSSARAFFSVPLPVRGRSAYSSRCA